MPLPSYSENESVVEVELPFTSPLLATVPNRPPCSNRQYTWSTSWLRTRPVTYITPTLRKPEDWIRIPPLSLLPIATVVNLNSIRNWMFWRFRVITDIHSKLALMSSYSCIATYGITMRGREEKLRWYFYRQENGYSTKCYKSVSTWTHVPAVISQFHHELSNPQPPTVVRGWIWSRELSTKILWKWSPVRVFELVSLASMRFGDHERFTLSTSSAA